MPTPKAIEVMESVSLRIPRTLRVAIEETAKEYGLPVADLQRAVLELVPSRCPKCGARRTGRRRRAVAARMQAAAVVRRART